MHSDRPKRPELDRDTPIRSFNGILGGSPSAVSDQARKANGRESDSSAVSSGVNVGYRVIEEYMRQGEAFARAVWSPAAAGNGFGADPQKLADRIYRYASDLAAAWLDYVQVTASQGSISPKAGEPSARNGPPGGFNVNAAAKVAEAPRQGSPQQNEASETSLPPVVSIELSSKRRAEITVELKPGSAACKLTAYDLRTRDSALPRVSGVVLETSPSDNRVLVRIALSDEQPPGLYTGLVVDDASNFPRGTVTVRLFE